MWPVTSRTDGLAFTASATGRFLFERPLRQIIPKMTAVTKPKDMAMARICSRVWISILLSSVGIRSRGGGLDDDDHIAAYCRLPSIIRYGGAVKNMDLRCNIFTKCCDKIDIYAVILISRKIKSGVSFDDLTHPVWQLQY